MSRRKRYILIAGAGLLVVVALAFLTNPSSPSGRYVANPNLALEGDFYWQFSGGHARIVYDGGSDQTGTYSFTNGSWFIDTSGSIHAPQHLWRIECSWFGVQLYDETGKRVDSMRRRIIPCLRPDWMPDWMQ